MLHHRVMTVIQTMVETPPPAAEGVEAEVGAMVDDVGAIAAIVMMDVDIVARIGCLIRAYHGMSTVSIIGMSQVIRKKVYQQPVDVIR